VLIIQLLAGGCLWFLFTKARGKFKNNDKTKEVIQ